MNNASETIPGYAYLTAKANSAGDVEKMHRAWCKSLQLQIALWTGLYAKLTPAEW